MEEPIREIEGTWEEVAARGEEWAGCRVRLTLLNTSPEDNKVVLPQRPQPTPEQAKLGIMPAAYGSQPIMDVEAWLDSLPHFEGTEAEFAAFEQAIAENRAMRRELAKESTE